LSSRNRDEMLPPNGYGRAQFLSDVAWMGLDREDAFSRANLRRQRDRLMHIHHPDRGGSEAMAARINVTYGRMLGWLDRHLENRSYLHMRRERVFAQESAKTAETPSAPSKPKTFRLYAAILGATATAVGLGVSTFIRRRS
jgi:hypothetical protein